MAVTDHRQGALATRPADELRRAGWWSLRGLHWPGRGRGRIDEVLVGPGGIVVVLDAEGGRPATGPTDEDLAEATGAVSALLAPAHRTATFGLLRLAGDTGPLCAGTCTIVGADCLPSELLAMPARLSPIDVLLVGEHLRATLDRPFDLLTTAGLVVDPAGRRRRDLVAVAVACALPWIAAWVSLLR